MMSTVVRGVADIALAVGLLANSHVGVASHAAGTAPAALAYVASGQVVVLENGNLTPVGPGQDPLWSPNGANLLTFTTDFVGGVGRIFVADTHGANSALVMNNVYPWVTPAWSPDSKNVLYTTVPSGTAASAANLTLDVRALNVASRKVRLLGHVPFTGGCSITHTALQDAFSRAAGAYNGIPGTLIWAQPNLVVIQSSCSGQGLSLLHTGGKVTTLANWSSGVLSPDGKTIVAAIVSPGTPRTSAGMGLLTVATQKNQVLSLNLGSNELGWSADGTAFFAVSEPANPTNGLVQIYRVSKDGKTVTILARVPGAGGYHLSADHSGRTLALAIVANGPANTPAPPSILVYALKATVQSLAQPLAQAGQPAWRPT